MIFNGPIALLAVRANTKEEKNNSFVYIHTDYTYIESKRLY
jgi:hypothetical protein